MSEIAGLRAAVGELREDVKSLRSEKVESYAIVRGVHCDEHVPVKPLFVLISHRPLLA